MFQGVDRCWSCLGPLRGVEPVRLSSGITLPCCIGCWSDLPVESRLGLAKQYAELFLTQRTRNQTADTLHAIENLFREALSDFQRRNDEREPWQRGDDDSGDDDLDLT
jgi:hypothetical protein